jgi:hypothetical protein
VEGAELGVIHERLVKVRTVFGQVRGRAQAASHYEDLDGRELLPLAELADKNFDAALAMLPDIAHWTAMIGEILAHVSDALVPVPEDER